MDNGMYWTHRKLPAMGQHQRCFRPRAYRTACQEVTMVMTALVFVWREGAGGEGNPSPHAWKNMQTTYRCEPWDMTEGGQEMVLQTSEMRSRYSTINECF